MNIATDSLVYDRSDFEQFLDDPSLYGSTGAAGDSVRFTEGLEPVDVRQFDKFKALYEKNENFRATWDKKRTDGRFQSDQDASLYCHSIAIFLVNAGWINDEILAAHYWWRGTHGELSGHRPDKTKFQIIDARKKAADNEAARNNGQAAAPAKPEPASYTVGNVKVTAGAAKETSSKITVSLEISVDGKPIDLLTLSTAADNRAKTAKAILAHLDDDAADQVKAMLGKILIDAREKLKAKVSRHDGDTMRNILRAEIEPLIAFRYVTEKGRVFDETTGRETTRAAFAERWTNNHMLALAVTAVDAPRAEDGAANRPALMMQMKRELEFLWGDLTHDLPAQVDADVDEKSAASVAFWDSIRSLFASTQTFSLAKQKVHFKEESGLRQRQVHDKNDIEESVQLGHRSSLAQKVREAVDDQETISLGTALGWKVIQTAHAAWFRMAKRTDPNGDEKPVPLLAMRYDLVHQVKGVKLEGVKDHRTMVRLGVKYGVFVRVRCNGGCGGTCEGRCGKSCGETTDGVSATDLASGGARLAILSQAFTDELLTKPDDLNHY